MRGLRNASNSCYANAVAQALAPLPALHAHLEACLALAHTRRSSQAHAVVHAHVPPSAPPAASVWAAAWAALLEDDDSVGARDVRGAAVAAPSPVSADLLALLRALSWPFAAAGPAPTALRSPLRVAELGAHFGGAPFDLQEDAHELFVALAAAVEERDAAPAAAAFGLRRALWRRSSRLNRWACSPSVRTRRARALAAASSRGAGAVNVAGAGDEHEVAALDERLAPRLASPFACMLARRTECKACLEAPAGAQSAAAPPWRVGPPDLVLTLEPPQGGPGALSASTPVEVLLRAFFGTSAASGFVCGNTACSHVAHGPTGRLLASNAARRCALLEPPRLLCLHLSRLQAGGKACGRIALADELDLRPFLLSAPASALPLSPALSRWQQARQRRRFVLRLMSVVSHLGGADTGHFVTYRRAPGSEAAVGSRQWLRCSDACVSPIAGGFGAVAEAAAAGAYMLFYARGVDDDGGDEIEGGGANDGGDEEDGCAVWGTPELERLRDARADAEGGNSEARARRFAY